MNEKSKIYIVLGVIVALILVIIGYNISVSQKSAKIYNEFVSDFESQEEKIVFIGREGCSWCQLFRPIFNYFTEKYDFSYRYIDTDKLVSRDFEKIINKIEISSDDFGTPLVVFVKNGQVTEVINGYVPENELLETLQKRGFVNSDEKISLNYLDFNSLKKVIKSKERSVIVVGQKYCSHCIRFKPVLMNVADTKGAKIYYINYDEVAEQDELETYLSQFKEFDNLGTPLTIIV